MQPASSRRRAELAARAGSGRTPRGSSTAATAASPASSRKRTARSVDRLRARSRRQPPSRAERGGAAVVLGQQRDHLVGAVAGALLDEAADLEVLARAHRLGQHPVGDVADQHVLERELALARAGCPRRPGRGCPSPGARSARRSRSRLSSWATRGQRARPERAPDDRRLLDEPALERLERVEPGREHRLHAVGQLRQRRSARPPASRRTISSAKNGLPPERSTTAGTSSRAGWSSPAAARRRARCVSSAVSGSRKSCVALRRPPPQLGAPLEQLVAREAEQQQRRAHPLREVLDHVEHAVVGPVDVLEGEHERAPARPSPRRPRAARRRRPRAGARGRPRTRAAARAGGSRPSEQPDQRGLALGGLAWPPRRPAQQLLARTRTASPRPPRRCRRRAIPHSARITSPSAQ